MLIRTCPQSDPGFCLINALALAGLHHPDIPDWPLIDDVDKICDLLGLEFIGPGSKNVVIKDQPVIIIYRINDKIGHAEYVDSIKPFIGKVDLIGIILL